MSVPYKWACLSECAFCVCSSVIYDLLFSCGFNGRVHRHVLEKCSLKIALFSPGPNSLQVPQSHTAKCGSEKTASSNVIIMEWAFTSESLWREKWLLVVFSNAPQPKVLQGVDPDWKFGNKVYLLEMCTPKRPKSFASGCMLNVLWRFDVTCSAAHQLAKPLPISFFIRSTS